MHWKTLISAIYILVSAIIWAIAFAWTSSDSLPAKTRKRTAAFLRHSEQ